MLVSLVFFFALPLQHSVLAQVHLLRAPVLSKVLVAWPYLMGVNIFPN